MEKTEKKEVETEKKKAGEEELPLKTSPYLQYKDLEDYKRKGYGTQGHLVPTPGRGGGATDAPTPSGDSVKGFPK